MNDTEFEHIVERLRERLESAAGDMAHRCRLSEADAEDAVQEALVRLWRMGGRLDGYRSVEALAVTIVKNVCIDMSRHAAPPAVGLDGVHIATDSTADSSLAAESVGSVVDGMIGRLPATQQRLLRMRGEGMSLDEIAAVCRMPKTSVKTLIARARRELLARYKKQRT